MGGCAVRSYDVDQRMFSTGFLQKGALEGNIIMKIYWETDNSTTDVVLELIVTDNDGTSVAVNVPTRTGTLTTGTRITYNFDSTKSYRLDLVTTGDLTVGKYVLVNYMRIDQLHTTVPLDTELYSDTNTTEPVALTQRGTDWMTAYNDHSANFIVAFPIAYDVGTDPQVSITITTNPWVDCCPYSFDFGVSNGLFVGVLHFNTSETPADLETYHAPTPIQFDWVAYGKKTPPISEDDNWTVKAGYMS
jgi:hypothetical protein